MANEASKTRRLFGSLERSVLIGKGLDIGCGDDPILPDARRFNGQDGDAGHITDHIAERFDYVFSSHLLQRMDDPLTALKGWWSLVKEGGHLLVVVPDEDLYEQGAWPSAFGPDHKFTFTTYKPKSWSPVSINVLDLIRRLPDCWPLKVAIQDDGYDYKAKVGTPRGQGQDVAQILFVLGKLPPRGGAPAARAGGAAEPEERETLPSTASPEWWRANYEGYLEENRGRLHEKYFRLVEGLDEESRSTVQMLVARIIKIYLYYGWANVRFELTAAEAEAVRRINEDLRGRVIQFPSGLCAYGKWLMPHADLEPGSFLYKCFIEELEDLQRLRGRDILDVGGYNGDSALVFSEYTDRRVFAFEPNPRNMRIMLETLRLNRADRIVPVPLGLGDRTEDAFMPDEVTQIGVITGKGVPVKVTTLDAWAAEHGDVEIGMIKVDIEGFEQRFLAGALETIRRHRPALLISINHNASDMFEIKPLIEGLGLGYRLKVRGVQTGYALSDLNLICEAG